MLRIIFLAWQPTLIFVPFFLIVSSLASRLRLSFSIYDSRSASKIRSIVSTSWLNFSIFLARHLQFLLKKKVLDFWSLSRFKLSSACLFPLWKSSNLSFMSSCILILCFTKALHQSNKQTQLLCLALRRL